MSESWIERSKAATHQTGRTIAVTLADGRRQVTPERKTLKSQKWCISELGWQESMTVIPLSGYDMILGKPWLAEHNPDIDFSRNTIKVRAGKPLSTHWQRGHNHGKMITLWMLALCNL